MSKRHGLKLVSKHISLELSEASLLAAVRLARWTIPTVIAIVVGPDVAHAI